MKYGMWLLLAGALWAQERSPEIVVIGGTGWSSGGKAIKRGDRLNAVAKLNGSGTGDLVIQCDKEDWLAYHCERACVVPVCSTQTAGVTVRHVHPTAWAKPQPSQPAAPNFLTSLFRREGNSVENLGVRAAGNLSDAVVRQNGDQILFAPPLARVLEGNYCFQMGPLPAGSAKPRTFTLEWNREGDAAVELRGVPAGLYTLERGIPQGGGACKIEDPDAAKAWILVAAGAGFERAQKAWEAYESGLSQLKDDSSPEVSATVSHAILASLADSLGK